MVKSFEKDNLPYDVFISYSRRDLEFVKRLKFALENKFINDRPVTVWLDKTGIAAGTKFADVIKHGILDSASFIFVVTPDSITSQYCTLELSYALTYEKLILPVLRRPVDSALSALEIDKVGWKKAALKNWEQIKDIDGVLIRKKSTDECECRYDDATKNIINPKADGAECDSDIFSDAIDKLILSISQNPVDNYFKHWLENRRDEWKEVNWNKRSDKLLFGFDIGYAERSLVRLRRNGNTAPLILHNYVRWSRLFWGLRRLAIILLAIVAAFVIKFGLTMYSRQQTANARNLIFSQPASAVDHTCEALRLNLIKIGIDASKIRLSDCENWKTPLLSLGFTEWIDNYVRLADACQRISNYWCAIDSYRQLINLEPNNFTYNCDLVIPWVELGKAQEAQQQLELCKAFPSDAQYPPIFEKLLAEIKYLHNFNKYQEIITQKKSFEQYIYYKYPSNFPYQSHIEEIAFYLADTIQKQSGCSEAIPYWEKYFKLPADINARNYSSRVEYAHNKLNTCRGES